MTDAAPPPPSFLDRPGQPRLAYRFRDGSGPAIVFLPGYMSDMLGSKAEALDAWAAQQGRAFLRLDYAGCGESEGLFEAGTLASWRDDARAVIEAVVPGRPFLLVGSSMGGWLAMLLAEAMGARLAGLVGVAAAPDFTDWGFNADRRAILSKHGRLVVPNPYGDRPSITTQAFWDSGQALRMLERKIAIHAPIRLLHGQADPDVPWEIALRIAGQVSSANVQTLLVKDGDHRLSRPQDIKLLVATLAALVE